MIKKWWLAGYWAKKPQNGAKVNDLMIINQTLTPGLLTCLCRMSNKNPLNGHDQTIIGN
jgi:hypothetical protein